MAFCVKCGNQLAENEKFCIKCGTAVSGATPQQAAPTRSNKDGDVIKCPSCGAPVSPLDGRCPECGHEFRNRSATKSVSEFFEHYRSANPSEKAAIIRAFPVPNTREDILTFLTMGIGNVKGLTFGEENTYRKSDEKRSIKTDLLGGRSREGTIALRARQQEIEAWRAKVQQVIDMGKLLLKDGENQALLQKYEQQLQKERKKLPPRVKLVIGGAAALLFLILLIAIASHSNPKPPEEVGEAITIQVENVQMSGSLAGYYKIKNCQLILDNKNLTLVMEAEALKSSFNADAEKKINDVKKAKGWENDNVSYKLVDYSSGFSLGTLNATRDSGLAAIREMLRMDPGETRNFSILFRGNENEMKRVMEQPLNSISSQITYQLTNNSRVTLTMAETEYIKF
jgi:DNA-directed RNA polymerase subunit RPC12/RpoP